MAKSFVDHPRALAAEICMEVERQSLLIPDAMARLPFKLAPQDVALAVEIAYGTFRYLPGLERALRTTFKVKKVAPRLRWLLLTALYQLGFMRAPAYAVIDETVNLAKRLGFAGLKGLVNGVLRNADRSRATWRPEQVSPDWLLPAWLQSRLTALYGKDKVATWCDRWQERGETFYWAKQALPGDEAADMLPNAFRATRAMTPQRTEESKVYVQNLSSQWIAASFCGEPIDSFLDVCAAPGGKSCYVATFGNVGFHTACDASSERLVRLIENRARLALDFDVKPLDAASLGQLDRNFSHVLVDAPCSGIGIIGRHPEIKFLKKATVNQETSALQTDILNHAWQRVEPGGSLLFTVCSLDSAELPPSPADAIDQTQAWLAAMPASAPIMTTEHGFLIEPSAAWDGFSGRYLVKPTS